eukprot:TRINITY_DN0_c0_g1_i2.p1 TRINITY_DN0_c0_g1~~TRINITY_DN0_c0_g1_i2.p1  ORF type:complete len:106 (-),score=27.32 TRINITY_DN0_c0_g1_i2:244-561(-)
MATTLASRIAQALTTNAGRKAQHDLYNEFYALPPAARLAIRNEIRSKLPQDLVKSVEAEFSRPGNNPAKHLVVASVLGVAVAQLWANYHSNYQQMVQEFYQKMDK